MRGKHDQCLASDTGTWYLYLEITPRNSGTVISDSSNVLPPATFISNWGTGTGGTGTYTLTNPGTVTAGETVTAVTGGVGSAGVNGFGWIAFDTVSNVAQGI
jgi:hypothetical protein